MRKSKSKKEILEQVSEDVAEASVYADIYSFLAVCYGFRVPHFYHKIRN